MVAHGSWSLEGESTSQMHSNPNHEGLIRQSRQGLSTQMLKPTLSSVLLTMTRFQGMMEDRTHGYKWETRAWLEPWVV
ncbi:hypothetical protein BDV35DRAFT_162278 [Aspergillus flavus]|uniref:Uncharacterized protein n=1 Tax=Aspergillus flavus TaxID=5059 RepID=A0A5N6H1U4_ASPFL|nr:hypothetical protein BDV35DRAFT_162278 [Aspergillus flavus]